MKKSILFPLAVFIANCQLLFAQAPEMLNYQGVVRDAQGCPMANQQTCLRFSILSGSTSGPTIYQETHTKISDALGFVTAQVGNGTIVSGTFSTVPWGLQQSGNRHMHIFKEKFSIINSLSKPINQM